MDKDADIQSVDASTDTQPNTPFRKGRDDKVSYGNAMNSKKQNPRKITPHKKRQSLRFQVGTPAPRGRRKNS